MAKKGKAICVFSAKGGVGKTITALNLAGIYSIMGKKVLIIDLDISGGVISVALNVAANKNIFNLSEDISTNRYSNFSDYVSIYNEHIHFIACPKDPRQAAKLDYRFLDLIIDRATYHYDMVIIDTNHFLNDINLVTMDKVDNILFIMNNEPFDMKNMKTLLSIFKDLEIQKFKLLLNNAANPYKNYFSTYDIKNILKSEIDYTISSKMFIDNIDYYIMNGLIITLDKKLPNTFANDYTTYMNMAIELLGEGSDK